MEDEFLKKMKGVTPIKKEDNTIKNKNSNTKKTIKKSISKEETIIKTKYIEKVTKSDFKISFSDINKDLKKGRISIDKKIDLHGYSLSQAETRFKKEIINSYNKKKRCLLFITGKGLFSKNKRTDEENLKPSLYYGKIKKYILQWIHQDELKKHIMTYQDAGIEQGGDGAIYVYLRKNKN
tara:strand:- start:154 stop:693 length:540 start_codon:yes stop_codon:yes gene_type:complete